MFLTIPFFNIIVISFSIEYIYNNQTLLLINLKNNDIFIIKFIYYYYKFNIKHEI